jgi:hypothetical protein
LIFLVVLNPSVPPFDPSISPFVLCVGLVWYVVDEVGSAVGTSEDPEEINCRIATFIAVTQGGEAFDIMWTTRDLEYGQSLSIYS